MTEHLWWFRARLVRVVDADTFELELDTGFHSRHVERVRLRGVDAPERFTEAGKAATAFVVHWFRVNVSEAPWNLIVHTHQVDSRHGILQDVSLGRYVADVYDRHTGESLADALVAAGHAVRSEA